MRCPECFGERFERGRFDYATLLDGRPVVFQNVPGQRCRQCDYLVVTSATLEKMDKIIGGQLAKTVVVASVFDFEQQQDWRADSTRPTVAPSVWKTA